MVFKAFGPSLKWKHHVTTDLKDKIVQTVTNMCIKKMSENEMIQDGHMLCDFSLLYHHCTLIHDTVVLFLLSRMLGIMIDYGMF